MAKGTIVTAKAVTRKKGVMYFVDGEGNVRSTPMGKRKSSPKKATTKKAAAPKKKAVAKKKATSVKKTVAKKRAAVKKN